MKKLLYLLLTVLIFACSSDDLSPVPACWDNPSFEGTWVTTKTVGEDPDVITTTYTYVFNSGLHPRPIPRCNWHFCFQQFHGSVVFQ